MSKNIIWFISNKIPKLPIKQNMFYTSNNTEGKKEKKPDNKLWLVKIDNCRLFSILRRKKRTIDEPIYN